MTLKKFQGSHKNFTPVFLDIIVSTICNCQLKTDDGMSTSSPMQCVRLLRIMSSTDKSSLMHSPLLPFPHRSLNCWYHFTTAGRDNACRPYTDEIHR
ncbi:hypothetical protein TNIN_15601 [Trichonephila inaurata madagascariensis]|uniref:Uncharacterized protein n=1 Tax=Trichonephila inaurata madagascariensis TaxID=2747483 RepID=A0A8X6WS59_9ARAC|nr:hypothetical protein TNIN_15601 [Trichonephila inaurata madagascariensis]